MKDAELARLCERVEVRGFADWHAAATPALAEEFGLAALPVADGIAIRARAFPDALFNRAFGFGLERRVGPDELEAVLAFYESAEAFAVHVCPFGDTGDARAWLEARGFVARRPTVKWVRSTDAPPDASTNARIEVIGAERAAVFAGMCETLFETPRVAPWVARVVGRPNWRHYVAYDGDEAVGIGGLWIDGEVGNLNSAATVERCRGRGIQSALIARRIRDAADAGCRWVVVETAEDRPDAPSPSYRNQHRAGFRLLYVRPGYMKPEPKRSQAP